MRSWRGLLCLFIAEVLRSPNQLADIELGRLTTDQLINRQRKWSSVDDAVTARAIATHQLGFNIPNATGARHQYTGTC